MGQVLTVPYDDSIDLGELARSRSPSEIKKFLELVIYAVIRCEEKEKYIGRILQLSQVCQGELMVFIETVLAKFDKLRASLGEDGDEVVRLQQVNAKLTRDLEAAAQELLDERSRSDSLLKQLTEAKSFSKTRKPELEALEVETRLAEKTEACRVLQAQIDELKKSHQYELTSLRDELDVATEQLVQIPKLESALESYKKKADEVTAMKKHLKEVESYNTVLKEKMRQLEDERLAIAQTHHSLAVYKDQLTQEKEKSAALSLQLQAKEREVKEYLLEKIQWDEKRQVFEAKIQRLTEELDRTRNPDNASDDSFSSFHKTYNTDLEEQVRTLENENRRLQVMIGNEELVRHFNEQIDSALLAKKQLEDRLKQVMTELAETKATKEYLEVKVQTLESSLSLTSSQLKDAEESTAKLQEEVEKLRTVSQENERMKAEKDGFMSDLKQLYRDKDELQRKCLEAKEEAHHYREEVTGLQARVRELEVDKEHAELKLKEAQSADAEVVKVTKVSEAASDTIKQLEIERENLKMSVEISTLKLTLRERDDEIKDLQNHKRLIEESMQKALHDQKEALMTQQQEELMKAKQQLEEKEKELEALSSSTDEIKSLWFKEERLMVAVMHEIGIEVFKTRAGRDTAHPPRSSKG